MFHVKKTASDRPVFTHAIRKADSVITHSDEKGMHIYLTGPTARKMTMSQLMALSIGTDLAVWSIVDYRTAGPLTALYQVRYGLVNCGYLMYHEITVELGFKAHTAKGAL